jgi:hypothetical protein
MKSMGQTREMRAANRPRRDRPLSELLARELIGVCMATLKHHGLPGKRLAALAREAALDQSGQIRSATAVLAEAHQLAELTNRWVEDPAYRDSTGRPAVLALEQRRGRSFGGLARQFFPGRSVTSVLALACDARVIERIGAGKVALVNSTVLFTGSSLNILAYAIRSIRRLLATAEFNRRANASALENWPDRTSYVSVSDRDFHEFVRVFRPQISDLIESSNRWLSQRSIRSGRRGARRVAGLQAFVFQE